MKLLSLVSILFFYPLQSTYAQTTPPQTPPENTVDRLITIAAVGDIQMGMGWPDSKITLPPNDAKDLFKNVHAILSAADVAFGNLETVLADSGDSQKCSPQSTRCYAFRVPTNYAASLKLAGFDVLSTANNHSGDFGMDGRVTTRNALDQVSILHSGPVGDVASWAVKGTTIALIGFSTGEDVHRVQDIETASSLVRELAKNHDIVIGSFHGGAEGPSAVHVPKGPEKFLGEDRGDLRKFTHALIDAGAHLVLGHGPHVLRGMEIYKKRLIAYSMGNFSSWNTFNLKGPGGITAILHITLSKQGELREAHLTPLTILEPGIPEQDPERKAIDIVRNLSQKDFGQSLFNKEGRYQGATVVDSKSPAKAK